MRVQVCERVSVRKLRWEARQDMCRQRGSTANAPSHVCMLRMQKGSAAALPKSRGGGGMQQQMRACETPVSQQRMQKKRVSEEVKEA